MYRIKVNHLMDRQAGAQETLSFEDDVVLDPADAVVLTKPVTIEKIRFVKLDNEIAVGFENLSTESQAKCSRCLTDIKVPIIVENTERQFIIELPEEDQDETEDVFYVDKHTNEIDLYPMIREEILLHFPFIPLCCDGCKGLCSQCGTNLNLSTCSCKPESPMKQVLQKLLNS